MPLLEHCWLCSLRVAASVIAVYSSVAYIIAFFLEVWWAWDTGGRVPLLMYILATSYFLTSILSAILVRGVSERHVSHLLIWLCGILAIILPEAGLVLYMSIHFWKVFTLYGLTEITFWCCRLIVNVFGLVCVQSLYSLWKEENDVINSLRDLNKVKVNNTTLPRSRRSSVSSDPGRISNGYGNPVFTSQLDLPLGPPLRRSSSNLSLSSQRSLPVRRISPLPSNGYSSEFNASKFENELRFGSLPRARSQSLHDLSIPSPIYPPMNGGPHSAAPAAWTQSLDRRTSRPLSRTNSSLGFFPSGEGRLRNGYFSPTLPPPGFLLDHLGRVVYIQSPELVLTNGYPVKQPSKASLAESDDAQRYKDVAL